MAGYIGSKASVVTSGAERKKVFDITATTTSLTGCSYTPNQVHVFHNGVRLVDGTDYTATDGSTVTLTTAAQSGDEVVVISYATFQTSDTVSASAGGTFTGDVTFSGAFTSQGIDDNATSTAMTLDTSGNLLVAKTASSLSTTGVQLNAEGSLSAVKAGTTSYFNRLSTDGEITRFLKDGTTVGSIGSRAGEDLYIGSGDTFGKFVRSVDAFVPANSDGSLRDNAINLGAATGRFKNLYLSGGVYLGGTGAANYLDDYEEGTWTPTAENYDGGTMTVNAASYIKIGRLVWMYWDVSFSGNDGSNCEIGGWPFSEAGDLGDQARGGATVTFNSTNTNGLWNVGSNSFIFKALTGNSNRSYSDVNTGQKRLGGSGFIYTS